jgi:hypothetical protein
MYEMNNQNFHHERKLAIVCSAYVGLKLHT